MLSGRWPEGKKLTVNVNKSHVVVYNVGAGAGTSDVPLECKGRILEYKDAFKHLGVVFDKWCGDKSMRVAMEGTAGPLTGSIRSVQDMGKELGLTGRPHAMVWLFQAYAFSVGVYGCQVWSTHYLKGSKVFDDSMIQWRHVAYMRTKVTGCE